MEHPGIVSDLVEIAKDENGVLLWQRPYIFKRLSAKGEQLCEAGQWYVVISSEVEGQIVQTILRAIAVPNRWNRKNI